MADEHQPPRTFSDTLRDRLNEHRRAQLERLFPPPTDDDGPDDDSDTDPAA